VWKYEKETSPLHNFHLPPLVTMCISCSYVKLIEPRTLRCSMCERRNGISGMGKLMLEINVLL
jgi:hypothetical protein